MIINKTGNPVITVSVVISMSVNTTEKMVYMKAEASQIAEARRAAFQTISLMELLACLALDF